MQTPKIQKKLVKRSKKTENKSKNLLKITLGVIIGFLNGFLGGGGGMICVPILEKILKMPPKKSHANTIAIIFPISFVSACVYCFNGGVRNSSLIFVLIGAVLGGIGGAFLLKILPEKVIAILFALIMIFMGVKMFI